MTKSVRPDENKFIDRMQLVRVLKEFKMQPNKVFVVKDFYVGHTKHFRKKYLHTLISLGLIEEVQAIWYAGHHSSTKRSAKGYKLKR